MCVPVGAQNSWGLAEALRLAGALGTWVSRKADLGADAQLTVLLLPSS